MITAVTRETGKSTLAELISRAAYGRPAGAAGWTEDQAEMRKVLVAILLEGQSSICFDNLPYGCKVDGDEIAKLLTQEIFEGRILGGNSTIRAPANVLVTVTGNQLSATGDMNSRLLPIRMNANMENPARRKFARPHIEDWVDENRPDIVCAVNTIFRAWIDHGRGVFELAKPSRFVEWDDAVRAPLMWLGQSDVIQAFDSNTEEDPYRELWSALYESWFEEYGSAEISCKELIDRHIGFSVRNALDQLDDVGDAIMDMFDGDRMPTAKHLGFKLRRQKGAVVGEYQLISAKTSGTKSKRSAKWRICSVAQTPSSELPARAGR